MERFNPSFSLLMTDPFTHPLCCNIDVKEEERIEPVNRYIMGDKPSNICRDLNMSEKWLFTWVNRFKTGEEEWYKSLSRAPKKHRRKTRKEIEL